MLISFAVTVKLTCVFVFAYADCWFSHDAAHVSNTCNNAAINQTLLLQEIVGMSVYLWIMLHFHEGIIIKHSLYIMQIALPQPFSLTVI